MAALAMLVGRSRTYARGDIQSRRDYGKLRLSLLHVGQLVRVANVRRSSKVIWNLQTKHGAESNQNCIGGSTVGVTKLTVHPMTG